jgi:hypothetical protein
MNVTPSDFDDLWLRLFTPCAHWAAIGVGCVFFLAIRFGNDRGIG